MFYFENWFDHLIKRVESATAGAEYGVKKGEGHDFWFARRNSAIRVIRREFEIYSERNHPLWDWSYELAWEIASDPRGAAFALLDRRVDIIATMETEAVRRWETKNIESDYR